MYVRRDGRLNINLEKNCATAAPTNQVSNVISFLFVSSQFVIEEDTTA